MGLYDFLFEKGIQKIQKIIFEKRECCALLFFLDTTYYFHRVHILGKKKEIFFLFPFVSSAGPLSQENSRKNICFT
jgi:hypothetical protein